jgi:hypothetical protein
MERPKEPCSLLLVTAPSPCKGVKEVLTFAITAVSMAQPLGAFPAAFTLTAGVAAAMAV